MLAVSILTSACIGCGLPAETFIPLPDRASFDAEVMPVLARDCAFPVCHGGAGRPFRIFAPGRTRFETTMNIWDPITAEESEANYQRTLSMLVGAQRASETLLLRKPLAAPAGGSFHRGIDEYERDVYADVDEPGYRVLEAWARRALGETP